MTHCQPQVKVRKHASRVYEWPTYDAPVLTRESLSRKKRDTFASLLMFFTTCTGELVYVSLTENVTDRSGEPSLRHIVTYEFDLTYAQYNSYYIFNFLMLDGVDAMQISKWYSYDI